MSCSKCDCHVCVVSGHVDWQSRAEAAEARVAELEQLRSELADAFAQRCPKREHCHNYDCKLEHRRWP